MRLMIDLFLAFFRIGLFTFGGGYAMLPLIEKEAAQKNKWTTMEEILDIFSMSQCTPGVIAVNAATFVGNKVAGVKGAVASTLGVITPSLIIISLIAGLVTNYAHLPLVASAFGGIRVAVAALTLSIVIKLAKQSLRYSLQFFVALGAFIAIAVFGVSPIVIVIVSGVIGFFFCDLSKINGEGTNHA